MPGTHPELLYHLVSYNPSGSSRFTAYTVTHSNLQVLTECVVPAIGVVLVPCVIVSAMFMEYDTTFTDVHCFAVSPLALGLVLGVLVLCFEMSNTAVLLHPLGHATQSPCRLHLSV